MPGPKRRNIKRRVRRNEVNTAAASNSNDVNVTEIEPHTHICTKCSIDMENTDEEMIMLKQREEIVTLKQQIISALLLLAKTTELGRSLKESTDKLKAKLEYIYKHKLIEPVQEMDEGKDTKEPIASTSTCDKLG